MQYELSATSLMLSRKPTAGIDRRELASDLSRESIATRRNRCVGFLARTKIFVRPGNQRRAAQFN